MIFFFLKKNVQFTMVCLLDDVQISCTSSFGISSLNFVSNETALLDRAAWRRQSMQQQQRYASKSISFDLRRTTRRHIGKKLISAVAKSVS